jgi:hypothetical protein
MTCFEIVCQHLPGGTEENYQEPVMLTSLNLYNIRPVLGARHRLINSENGAIVMNLRVNKPC